MPIRHATWEIKQRIRWFRARFDGECDACGEDIDAGQMIARIPDGDYLCEQCGEEWEREHAD